MRALAGDNSWNEWGLLELQLATVKNEVEAREAGVERKEKITLPRHNPVG